MEKMLIEIDLAALITQIHRYDPHYRALQKFRNYGKFIRFYFFSKEIFVF